MAGSTKLERGSVIPDIHRGPIVRSMMAKIQGPIRSCGANDRVGFCLQVLGVPVFHEHAGVSIREIKKRSHDLRGLLKDVSKYEVLVEVTHGKKSWVPASRLRAMTIDLDFLEVPVGVLINGEDEGASQYPN